MSIANVPNLQSLARALGGEVSGSQVLAPGPSHSANDRSLSIKLDPSAPDGFVVNSFAGDDPIACKDYVRSKAGIEPFKANGKRKPAFDIGKITAAQSAGSGKPKGNIVATYDYRDDKGELLYQVCRFEPKSFRQRRPDGKGGWIWSVKDCRRIPYRLPELLKYPDACVFVCEGEKDADRVGCGRDASYLVPPAQIRTCSFPAYGSHLGCVTAKRLSGQGWRIRGLGSQSSISLSIRALVRLAF